MEEVTQAVKRTFEKYDQDNNGELDQKEFTLVLEDLCNMLGSGKPTPDHVMDSFIELDINNDGKIGWVEFSRWYQRIYLRMHPPRESDKAANFEAYGIFSYYDKDKSGSIDRREFDSFLTELYQSMRCDLPSKAEVDEAFTTIDKNGNGKIDFNEFSNWWTVKWPGLVKKIKG
eukprot:TRINITY_DN7871_c0_g1_i1.p1 TRINITY_DN7871_c0_g1~~TRINITY_DN7871_c0_g1_i1.p1  ORF type:complete len:185 (+),score=34.81 TRINITY_DN7871_c0_g1_i1:39-557(+)